MFVTTPSFMKFVVTKEKVSTLSVASMVLQADEAQPAPAVGLALSGGLLGRR